MKKYSDKNVYEAAVERVQYIFDEFENIYVSFSGGKDSGVCTHLMCEEARKRKRKIGLLYIDIEANYKHTVDNIKSIIKEYKDVLKPMWVCLPMETNNALSYYETMWTWWERGKESVWVRKMPKMKYVINLENNPIDYYKEGMTFESFVDKFGQWYGHGEKTACIIGIRTQESLNRWRALTSTSKETYKGKSFSTKVHENVYNFYPIYDWEVEDIWTYYGKTGKQYNKFYDLMYQAGVPITKMRIDEPFGDAAKAGLDMFRVIEPTTWAKVVNRVSGANFANIYSKKSINRSKYKLPSGHTWESFTQFLLDTLPPETADHYRKKFDTFIKWWIEKGSPMPPESIKILEENYGEDIINTHEFSVRGKGDKEVIKFKKVVDEIPELDSKDDVLSWRRMAMAILKNDYYCSSLSFGITKAQAEKRRELLEYYEHLL